MSRWISAACISELLCGLKHQLSWHLAALAQRTVLRFWGTRAGDRLRAEGQIGAGDDHPQEECQVQKASRARSGECACVRRLPNTGRED